MSGDAGALSECEVKTLMTPDHTAFQLRSSGKGQTGIGRSSWKAISQDATRRLQLIDHAADWLHSMVFNGRGANVFI